MKPFRDWSIGHKLTGLLVAMAFVTAITVALPIAAFDVVTVKRAMVRDLATLADVLARNSTAALTFRDQKSAEDVLEALRAEPAVTAACIYTEDGRPFAKYVRDGNPASFLPPLPHAPVSRFESGHLIQVRNIVLNGDVVGTIYIASDLQTLDNRYRQYEAVFAAMLLATLTLALLIAPRLQRPISRPLSELVATASAISAATDYSIRAETKSGDEFGVLVSSFNSMLDQIERRDGELRHHREQLEETVAARTGELVMANAQLRRAEEKYRAIFEDAVIGIFQATPEGRPLSINRALAEIHGYDSPEQLMFEVSNVVGQLFVHPEQMAEYKSVMEGQGTIRNAELELYRRDRSKKWVLANMRGIRNSEGRLILIEGTIEDITDRKRAEERVQFLAYYDALTGLPNRTLLQDRLGKALAGAARHNEKIAALFIDLNRFKIINDSLGHSFGDLLLREVSKRLKKWAREQDTVARIGGDEFVIAMSGIKDVPDAAVAAERIMDAMTSEFDIQGRKFAISCSIGISIYPEHGIDSETLIKNADAAMYCAKEAGRNAFRFFTDEMNAQVVERLNLEHSLRPALERNELFLVYQPQVDLATGRIVGIEALLRWTHPDLGSVPPDKFIRIAENSGLILPIGEWVLKTACTAARAWQHQLLSGVPVAVNVSAVQFRQEAFHALVQRVLQETGLEPQWLELELTETLLLSNADVVVPVLHQLKEMGVKLAIDDFGIGYSSLSYLRQFPVSKLKIDRSFIGSVAENADDAAITAAIISMGKSLNLKVIAEGVENESQMDFLRKHQCDEIQGYYCSKPLTLDELTRRLSVPSASRVWLPPHEGEQNPSVHSAQARATAAGASLLG